MANTIKIRRSATAGAVPTTGQLALGELAINTYDGKLYTKKSVSGSESIVEIGVSSGGSGSGAATGGGSDQWALEHDNTITTSYTVGAGKNVVSVGPMTVQQGATVTLSENSIWHLLY